MTSSKSLRSTSTGPKAKPRYAQHFLESAWVDRLVRLIKPKSSDTFIEIGPGRGALTLALATSGAKIIAIEIDRKLVNFLQDRAPSNVSIMHSDFLKVDLSAVNLFPEKPVRIVGNLPYNAGSPILIKLLNFSGRDDRLHDGFLMLQKEVAARITSKPGNRDWGPLGIAVSLRAESKTELVLPPGAFRPMPQVDSAVVNLRFRQSPVKIDQAKLFETIVRLLFSHRRKKAITSLRPLISEISSQSPEDIFLNSGIDPDLRPAHLGLPQLAELTKVLGSTLT